ncbi:hypothetical protein TW80_01480 [Loktanella sp. S4079]|nr:hypothetical protein TW80_01480 [Loktanella sp. S4079]
MDDRGQWKRLFPIRFRQLSGEKAFSRWDIVQCQHSAPTTDSRKESCRVHEETIEIVGKVKRDVEKSSIVDKSIVSSEKEAISNGASLAVIRPTNVDLKWIRRSSDELDIARQSYIQQAAQLSLLDKELEAYQPCPFEFKMHYQDGSGPHKKTCADWETAATFYKLSREMEEHAVLEHLRNTYCEQYVKKGLVFALGNMQKRPQTWQLLGIFPVEATKQGSLW